MGVHVCEGCTSANDATNYYPRTSSGDVTLAFDNGHVWEMPDMILHYLVDHKWIAPAAFSADVLYHSDVPAPARKEASPAQVGYLGSLDLKESGFIEPDWWFVGKLAALMAKAKRAGQRMQTRGL